MDLASAIVLAATDGTETSHTVPSATPVSSKTPFAPTARQATMPLPESTTSSIPHNASNCAPWQTAPRRELNRPREITATDATARAKTTTTNQQNVRRASMDGTSLLIARDARPDGSTTTISEDAGCEFVTPSPTATITRNPSRELGQTASANAPTSGKQARQLLEFLATSAPQE